MVSTNIKMILSCLERSIYSLKDVDHIIKTNLSSIFAGKSLKVLIEGSDCEVKVVLYLIKTN